MGKLDEHLRSELERLSPPADPTGVVDRVLRRGARRYAVRRVGIVALVVAVIAGSAAGVYGLSRVFGSGDRTEETLPGPATETPGPPTPSAAELRLGFPTCNVSSVTGAFESGVTGTAWVATKTGDVGCPQPPDADNVIAVDVDGDGQPDASFGPFACGSGCRAFAAPDLDGDGIQEIAVVTDETAAAGEILSLFRVTTDGPNAGAIIQFETVGQDGQVSPTQVPWGVSGPESNGAWCMMADRGPELSLWTTDQNSDGTFELAGTSFLVQGARLTNSQPWRHDGPVDDTELRDIVGDPQQFCGSPIASQRPPTPSPTVSVTDQPQNIGLAFPVCNVSSVSGTFQPAGTGTAWVATKMSDVGGCPDPWTADNVIAVDVDGDGLADLSYGPIECPVGVRCLAFAAPDIDGDGIDELAVRIDAGASTDFVTLYRVCADGWSGCPEEPGLRQFEVPDSIDADTSPEDAPGPIQFAWGGSVMHLAGAMCLPAATGHDSHGPIFSFWTADSSDGTSFHVRLASFLIEGTRLVPTGVGDYRVPEDEPELPSGGQDDLCGATIAPSS